jgi:hypothetical protein
LRHSSSFHIINYELKNKTHTKKDDSSQ